MQIGVYGNPETTPGGKALKFYYSVRIEVRRIAQIKKVFPIPTPHSTISPFNPEIASKSRF